MVDSLLIRLRIRPMVRNGLCPMVIGMLGVWKNRSDRATRRGIVTWLSFGEFNVVVFALMVGGGWVRVQPSSDVAESRQVSGLRRRISDHRPSVASFVSDKGLLKSFRCGRQVVAVIFPNDPHVAVRYPEMGQCVLRCGGEQLVISSLGISNRERGRLSSKGSIPLRWFFRSDHQPIGIERDSGVIRFSTDSVEVRPRLFGLDVLAGDVLAARYRLGFLWVPPARELTERERLLIVGLFLGHRVDAFSGLLWSVIASNIPWATQCGRFR